MRLKVTVTGTPLSFSDLDLKHGNFKLIPVRHSHRKVCEIALKNDKLHWFQTILSTGAVTLFNFCSFIRPSRSDKELGIFLKEVSH
jgi:hypothetical protein